VHAPKNCHQREQVSPYSLTHQQRLQLMEWLAQQGPKATKHQGFLHPIAVCVLQYAIVATVTFKAHDALLEAYLAKQFTSHQTGAWNATTVETATVAPVNSLFVCSADTDNLVKYRRLYVAAWILPYSIWLLVWRHFVYQPAAYRQCVWYEYTWLCNKTLNMGVAGLLTHRPIVAAAYCVTVGIDQLLWYADLLVYAWTGKFPVGVAKYIFWEGVTWSSRITCTHHLWTIPLLLYATQGMHILAFPLSIVVMTFSVVLSRFWTPSHVVQSGTQEPKYLNVNLAHTLWKDIRIEMLQISADDPGCALYLWRLLSRWTALNAIVFWILYATCQYVYGQPAPVC
jgi:hypothetical protein